MGSNPAVLFYTSDWLSGTLLFNYEQKGQYIDLLCIQHQIYPQHIPKDRMMIVCLSYDNPVFKKFVTDGDGNYYNERMEIEIKKRISFCESRKYASNTRNTKKDHTIHHTIDHTVHRIDNDIDNDLDTRIKEEGMQGEKSMVPEKPQAKTIPPKIEWIKAYCDERRNGIDAQAFFDHYETRGWVPKGSTKQMKDWQAAIRTWEKYKKDSEPPKPLAHRMLV
jgi:hypothetical protein